jgi:hypothetical protein
MRALETLAGPIDFKNLLLAALIFIPVEQLLPMHEGQKVLRRAWRNDLVYALLNGIVVGTGLTVIVALVLVTSEWLVPKSFKAVAAGQPYWLQLIEIIVPADLASMPCTGFSMPFRCSGAPTPCITASRKWTGWRRTACIRWIRS